MNVKDEAWQEQQRQIKSNKDRSKAYRKRKKEFFKDLEQKANNLERENEDLRAENKRLQEIIEQGNFGKKEFKTKLEENEDYVYNNIMQKIKKDPESLRLTMISQAYEDIGEYSAARIEIIKQHFKSILDNIASFDNKVVHCCFKGMSASEFVRKQRSKKRNIKFAKKYETAKDLFTEYDFSDLFIKAVENGTTDYLKPFRKIQKIAQQLVCLRNKLINTWKEIRDQIEGNDCSLNFEKQDLANFSSLFERLKKTNLISTHKAWEIPVKTHTNPLYEGGELTDDNNETDQK
ncbi:unnamed protein product [Moneuplotes crassus]|uniref:BZIP domain-containing protein n=1 Tax=Euplotes crassus TaxID=5936 RepID=A0AAD1XP55_EUPCR|nr:unnamed protein product [Moneuplotes crassus]